MLPPGDPSLLAGSAAVLDGAALAGVGPVATQHHSIFLVRVVVGEPFTGRTNVNVLLSHVAKVLLTEAPCRICYGARGCRARSCHRRWHTEAARCFGSLSRT